MHQTATTTCSARLSLDGQKIVLRGYSPELVEFYRSLPGAKYDPTSKSWACLATPAAAWRVCEVSDAGEPVRHLASRFGPPRDETGFPHQPYVVKTQPWRHQSQAFSFAVCREACELAMEMGTGKSLVAILLADNLNAKRVCILCPKSVLPVWRREFERHAANRYDVLVLDGGTVAKKQKEAERRRGLAEAVGGRFVVVVNYESAWRKPLGDWLLAHSWDIGILDESHRAKAHNTATSKFVAKLGRRCGRRLCLTGTPMPHSPLDVFGQCRFLDPGLYGDSWRAFSDRYAIKGNPSIPQQITGYRRLDELQERFALLAYRCDAADVLDLPEAIHHELTCELSPTARRAYDELESELITEVEAGTVTVANALVKLLRLQQVASGFLSTDDEGSGSHEFELATDKADTLQDFLEDVPATEPVVVFCRFRHDLAAVSRIADRTGRVYGELSGRRRDGLTDRGTMSEGIGLLGCQIQSGGVGIDLTRARHAVYYSIGFNLGDFLQSLARLHRPGQSRSVHYYHLIAENTVDRAVYGALKKKRDVVESVLSILKTGGHDGDGND